MSIQGKHILLGVTGGIAAYKCANLIRLFVKAGAEVRVIMTPAAKAFITPLTLATLSKNPIGVEFYNPENGDWNSHVSYGLWSDLMLIAPATANTLGKMANGIADNLLLTSYLSAKSDVMVAPAMDLDMYRHVATQRNMAQLKSDGVLFVEAEEGELASGLTGKGRMAEPEQIFEAVKAYFEAVDKKDFIGRRVLISAGPTYEKIDPVRFIGNYSSGKMGFAIADEFARRGATVTLVAGPVDRKCKEQGIERIDVESAEEMFNAMVAHTDDSDIVVSCAAVADFTPEIRAVSKVKRGEDDLVIRLKPTKDIAAELGRRKHAGQLLVGFALETDNESANAKSKLERKNLDLIVLNSLKDSQACFGFDTNKVTLIERNGGVTECSLKAKSEVATDIVNKIKEIYNEGE